MGKVLLIVSIIITAATAVLGFLNKGKLDGALQSVAEQTTLATTAQESLKKAQEELKTAKDTLVTSNAEKDQFASQAESLKSELDKAKADLTAANTQMGTKDSQIAQLTSDIQTKEQEIATLKQGQAPVAAAPSAEDQAKMQEQETLIAKLTSDLDNSRRQLEELRTREQNRMALKMRDGLEGRVLAVNQAWNFVVLNLGDRNGVVSNAEMLVKRGPRLIGKVRVTSVEPSTSIADIVANSVPRGFTIQPGDNVIYQSVEN